MKTGADWWFIWANFPVYDLIQKFWIAGVAYNIKVRAEFYGMTQIFAR